MNRLIEFYIPGRPIVKKNTKRIYGSGRKKRVVYSGKYRFWEAVALNILKQYKVTFKECLEMHVDFVFKNRVAEPDLSNLIEGIQDVMQTAGIIENDKQIHKLFARKFFYAEQDGVRVSLYGQEYKDYEYKQK